MNRPIWPALLATALLLAACVAPIPTRPPTYRTFGSAAAIAIPAAGDAGPADPYPSAIFVDDMPTVMSTVRVRLTGFSHTFPSDVDVLLVGPQGEHALLLSDVGGTIDGDGITLIFDAAATEALPQIAPLVVSGVYLPSNYGDGDTFAAPAPAGPYGTDLSVFEGTDPNGTWRLFVVDDLARDVGAIAGGWSLTFLVD